MDKKENNLPESEIEFTGEDNMEEAEIIEEEENQKDKISSLKAKLKACEEEKRNSLEDLQRTKADFLNSKKRLEEQSKANTENALNKFLASLLPMCDSFDMAMSDSAAWEAIDTNWRKGVEGIRSQLASILKQHDVLEIAALGEHFDPNRHEAMSTADEGKDSDTVLQVLQKGYERNGIIIRPAKVIIQN